MKDARAPIGDRSLPSLWTGELDDASAARLLDQVEMDGALSEELDFAADLVAAAEQERDWLETGVRSPMSAPSGVPSRMPSRMISRAVRRLGVLAAAGVLVWFLWPVQELTDRIHRAPPLYVPVELRGPDDELAKAFQRAMEPYRAGDYPSAAAALERFLADHPAHGPARFYRAASLAQLGLRGEAEAEFSAVARGSNGYLAEHALWQLAQVQIIGKQEEEARSTLEEIRARGGAFAGNAADLLERMEAR